MNKIALITGATSGIGRAVADIFAENKYNLIVTGRRSERLQELKAALEQQHGIGVLALCFDVRDNDEVVRNIASLPVEWCNIDVLVNNAGLAVGLNIRYRSSFCQSNIDISYEKSAGTVYYRHKCYQHVRYEQHQQCTGNGIVSVTRNFVRYYQSV